MICLAIFVYQNVVKFHDAYIKRKNYDFSKLPPHIVAKILDQLWLRDFNNAVLTCQSWYYASWDTKITNKLKIWIPHNAIDAEFLVRPINNLLIHATNINAFKYKKFLRKHKYSIRQLEIQCNQIHATTVFEIFVYLSNVEKFKISSGSKSYSASNFNACKIIQKNWDTIIRNMAKIKSLGIETRYKDLSAYKLLMEYCCNIESFYWEEFDSDTFKHTDFLYNYILNPHENRTLNTTITELHVHSIDWTQSSKFFEKLVHLKLCNLKKLSIKEISFAYYDIMFKDFCRSYDQLESLSISGCNEPQLHEICKYLLRLKTLVLQCTDANNLSELKNLIELEYLNVDRTSTDEDEDDDLAHLFDSQLPYLRKLYLTYVNANIFQLICENCPNLVDLQLDFCYTKDCEPIFKNLTKLKVLRILFTDEPKFHSFYSLIERDEVATTALKHRSLTVFAPTNRAFQHHKLNRTFVLYHMVTSAFTLENLPRTILSDLDGNPPLYINNQGGEIFINNAKIVKTKSNQQYVTPKGNKQILHIIEEILVPLVPSPTSSLDNSNLDAFQFITYSESLDIDTHRVRTYRHRVVINKKEKLYQDPQLCTFFLPVEEGFKHELRAEAIDSKVIDGHIIPGNVLFTSSVKIDEPYPTLTFEENLRVTIAFFQDSENGKNVRTFVRSDTIVGDGVHTNGGVIAEIVKANIPVKNGVIHLISKPLMVVDNTVNQFLEMFKDREGGPLTKFHDIILDFGGPFMDTLKNLKDVTLFAPNNEAWQDKNIQKMLGDSRFIREILDLHVVPMRVNVERIKQNVANKNFFVPTLADRKSLFFNIVNLPDRDQIITVEGGGVNATITQADVAATNGFIHIIDHVLGAPYTTVLEKLKQDPLMRKTYELGENSGFNKRLNGTQNRFTYFVPADQAWLLTQKEFPSVHKKLFMADFQYHANNLLERHLVVADRKFTMAELKVLANDSLVLSTVRDSLKIKVKEDKQYYIYWDDKWLTVIRPDVDCTNGIIHVINRPFIRSNDIIVAADPFGGSNALKSFNAITFLCILFASIFHIYI